MPKMTAATTVNVRLVIAVSLTSPDAWRGLPRHVTREPGSRFPREHRQARRKGCIDGRETEGAAFDNMRKLCPHPSGSSHAALPARPQTRASASCSTGCDRYTMVESAGVISEAIHENLRSGLPGHGRGCADACAGAGGDHAPAHQSG